ncbi:NEAT domain-containing protein [Alkalihalobacillus sp. 1P02AB]|uniref:NEAT domain-containing protein n=1 Tax=Alkalihalobacillus sp. 1P02AB TaxID=3132260 RepID=UPI0039A525A0
MKQQLKKLMILFSVFLIVFSSTLSTAFAETGTNEQLLNGEYEIDLVVYKDGTTETSVMDGYVNNTASLFVEDGGLFVHLTLLNSDWIKLFQTDQSGQLVDATVVSEDLDNDTRIVRFPIEDLNQSLDAYTHVVIKGLPGMPNFDYDNKYTVQIQFDSASLKEINVEQPEEVETPEEETEEPGEEVEIPEEGTEEPGEEVETPEEGTEEPGEEVETPEEGTEEPGEEVETPDLEDGTYAVAFSALHATEDRPSTMD